MPLIVHQSLFGLSVEPDERVRRRNIRRRPEVEEAVKCFKQAADIDVRLRNQIREGGIRSNLASTLIELQRYDEARRELQRAFECNKPNGYAAMPWNTWAILHNLELVVGNTQAAAQAGQQAIELYLAFRRQGGKVWRLGRNSLPW